MRSFLTAALLWSLVALSNALTAPLNIAGVRRQAGVDDYINKETPIAKAGIRANIGGGSRAPNVKPGVVIASPSTFDPDYFYTWIRDSALVFKVLIDEYVGGRDAQGLQRINEWVASMTRIQQVENPSGSLDTGGLGEPKFEADETAFTDGWGRPQRDGPALRATSMITFANHLITENNATFVRETIWPAIKLDLDYTSNAWNLTGFDLWEEVSGASFFTTAAQHRALREGATLARTLQVDADLAHWEAQAANALCFLQSYWTKEDKFIVANVGNGNRVRSGLDSNTILASIHTFDPSAGCDSTTFQPCSDKALSNLKVYVDSFRNGVYPINHMVPRNQAVALGRYFEDVYYNGNPWYLTTLAVTEQLYRAVHTWEQLGQGIQVTDISLAFFQQFLPSLNGPRSIAAGSSDYTTVINGIKAYADGFINVVAKYTPSDGELAEQYTKESGTPISARHLTWSYAAAITAFDARANVPVHPWGAAGLVVPPVCGTNLGPTSKLRFSVNADTFFGQNVFVTGNLDSISGWNVGNAIALSSANYPNWSAEITVPASTNFEYKYIKKDGSGNVVWESGDNRRATTPAKGQSGSLNDNWR